MRHARFDIASLAIEGVAVPLKAAYLLVAETDPDAPGPPAWECLAYGFDTAPLVQARFRIDLTTLDGRMMAGDAIVVRSVEGSHVLRGDGPLDGVVDTDLGPASTAPLRPGWDPGEP